MGTTPNLVGQKFGKLIVVNKTNQRENNGVVWECQCDCYSENSIAYVTTANLKSGRVRSCGCLVHEPKFEDLTGQKFGRLTVLHDTGKNSNGRSRIWHCKCECKEHNELDVVAYMLKNGSVRSCGCLQKEIAQQMGAQRALSLVGEQFGLLTVIKQMPSVNGRSMWLCECACEGHNQKIVSGMNLQRGHISSCGCLKKSLGEYTIEQILKNNQIKFEKNVHFDDCKFSDTGCHAYFDFYVNKEYIIEYDGEQHYNPTCFNGIKDVNAMENFQKTQQHDQIKNDYCFDKNIPIIRIPYTHLKNISLEDLLIKTSKFVL
jgi:hypothetical protein